MSEQFSTANLKVLLVDDDDSIHEIIELFLANTEYKLISARSVPEAMALVGSSRPDIVITDAMMPGESGFCLIEKLKSSPVTAKVPVILGTILEEMNGGAMDASRKADFSLSKPFYRDEIIDCLEKARTMIGSVHVLEELTITF